MQLSRIKRTLFVIRIFRFVIIMTVKCPLPAQASPRFSPSETVSTRSFETASLRREEPRPSSSAEGSSVQIDEGSTRFIRHSWPGTQTEIAASPSARIAAGLPASEIPLRSPPEIVDPAEIAPQSPAEMAAGMPTAAIGFELVAGGLDSPVAITHAGDGSGRLFVTEQAGRIRIVDLLQRRFGAGGGLRAAPFLDIAALVSSGGERGLLSVAFAPDYATSGLFYVFYTNLGGDLVVARYSVSGDPDVANPAGTVLLTIPHPGAANHNGGQLQFGPDGFLYVGTGDGGGGGDPDGNAQDLGVLLGKILRLDVGGGPLAPPDNPFVDGSAATRDEIWAYGLRNPWRFSFDRGTGDLFIGDVGQGCWEEVDLQPARSRGGENYGWNVTEGSRCYDPPSCSPPPTCMSPSFTSPVLVYSHADPADCAVTGGFRYRGEAMPGLAGTYVFGDYCSGKIWGATESEGSWTSNPLADTPFLVSAFGEDEAGELYVADLGAGSIHRIVLAAPEPYADDFEDGDASDWTVLSGEWDVVSGDLMNSAARRAAVLAPYAGCGACTIEADLRIESPGGKAGILGWYESERSYVELRLSDRFDLVTLRRVLRGRVVFSRSVRRALAPSEEIHVAVTRSASAFSVTLGSEGSPAIAVPDRRPAFGTIGFRVGGGERRVSGALERISVR